MQPIVRNFLLSIGWLILTVFIVMDFHQTIVEPLRLPDGSINSDPGLPRIHLVWLVPSVLATYLAMFGQYRLMAFAGVPTLIAVVWSVLASP